MASRIDYCNSLLAGAPTCLLSRVQSVLNAAAKLLCGGRKYDHVTPLLRDRLHWLPIQQRIDFKLCLFVYKALHGMAPQYLTEYCVPSSANESRRRLRSATNGDLYVPRTVSKFGERAFSVAGPRRWNLLPAHVRAAQSVTTFKGRLKTHLFQLAYLPESS